MSDSDPGRQALAALDEVLRERPHAEGHAFSAATRHLAELRDQLIERCRGPAAATDHQDLRRVNAVISIVLAGHFPLGQVPWPEIEKARVWLDEILRHPNP